MDIIDRIRAKAPTEIDRFHADMERRVELTDDSINQILANVFSKIDRDRLTPELSYRWNRINDCLP